MPYWCVRSAHNFTSAGFASSRAVRDDVINPPPFPTMSMSFFVYSVTCSAVQAERRDGGMFPARHIVLPRISLALKISVESRSASTFPFGNSVKYSNREPQSLYKEAGRQALLDQRQGQLFQSRPVEGFELLQRHKPVRTPVQGYAPLPDYLFNCRQYPIYLLARKSSSMRRSLARI